MYIDIILHYIAFFNRNSLEISQEKNQSLYSNLHNIMQNTQLKNVQSLQHAENIPKAIYIKKSAIFPL